MTAEPIFYSASENFVFKRCRRRWFLQHVLRKTARGGDAASGALWVGTLVHAAMEGMRGAQRDKAKWELVRLTAISQLDLLVDERIEDGWAVDEKDVDLARVMVEGYLDWYEDEGIGALEDVVAVEQELSLRLSNGVVYRGKLDAVTRQRKSGSLRVVDTKTVQSLVDPTLGLQMSEQLMGYVMLAKEHYGEHVDGAEYSMLRKVKRTATAKPPFYGRHEALYGRAEMEAFRHRLNEVTNEALMLREQLAHLWSAGLPERAAAVAYPSPDIDCSWRCPFVAECELMNDPGSRWIEAVLTLPDGDPYERYAETETETTT